MTAIIQLPGVVVPQPGMELALIVNEAGFLVKGLQALYMLEDGAGTALSEYGTGADGIIDTVDGTNAVYAWLGGGGGLSLSGAQLASLPAFESNSAWTLLSFTRVVGDSAYVGAERIVGFVGLREIYLAGTARGSFCFARGPADLDVDHNTAYYVIRPANGAGAPGAQTSLIPNGLNLKNKARMIAHSYNGVDTIYSSVYDKDGNVIATVQAATNDAALFTIGGVTNSMLKPCAGGGNGTYAGAIQQVEAIARYSRALPSFTAAEIKALCANGAAIGAARGRAW